MCLARGMYFSRNTAGLPKARPASDWASSSSLSRSRGLVHHPHAASAAAKGGLDDEGETDLATDPEGFLAIGDRFLSAGKHGHIDPFGESAGGCLVAHHVEEFRARDQ